MSTFLSTEFREQRHVKHENNPMFLSVLFGQNKPENKNSHFLTLKNYKNEAFSDMISKFYKHLKQDVE